MARPSFLGFRARSSTPCKRHRWYHAVWTGARRVRDVKIEFLCWNCQSRYQRKVTPAEADFYAKHYRISFKSKAGVKTIHTVWHELQRKFRVYKDGGEVQIGGKPVKLSHPVGWKWSGYDLIRRLEKWADKYPKDVRTVTVDDDHFASSVLFLVEHQSDDQYMGTSVLYVAQCSGDPPAVFFMYPGHRRSLLAALEAINVASAPIEARQRAAMKARDAEGRKAVTLPKPTFQPQKEQA